MPVLQIRFKPSDWEKILSYRRGMEEPEPISTWAKKLILVSCEVVDETPLAVVVRDGPEAVLAPTPPEPPAETDVEPNVVGTAKPKSGWSPEEAMEIAKQNMAKYLPPPRPPSSGAAKPLPPPKPKDIWGRTFEDFPEAK